MKTNLACLLLAVFAYSMPSASQSPTADDPTFREPLKIDKSHYYEENFAKIPYVNQGDVYLFAGESFGISVAVSENQISGISYQPDPSKADVRFTFRQEPADDGWMTLLTTQNKLKRRLVFDALMTVPGKKSIFKTSVLPVEAASKILSHGRTRSFNSSCAIFDFQTPHSKEARNST